MEPEEIAVVLSRASELHSKLNDGIQHLLTSPSTPPLASPSLSARQQPIDGPVTDFSARPNLQNGVASPHSTPGDASVEVRSLTSIRDALEILADQLESLQVLQQQQRAERDAGLTEVEESRRILLKRLKEHKGRDSDIVQEALAFAGGTVSEMDDLPLPPYPKIDNDEFPQVGPISIPSRGSLTRRRSNMFDEQDDRSEGLDFEQEEGQEDDGGSDGDLGFEYEEDKDPDNLVGIALDMANTVKSSRAVTFLENAIRRSFAFIGQIAEKISGQVTGPSSKVVLIAVSTLAVLSLTDIGEKRRKSIHRVTRIPAHRSHHHHMGDHPSASSSQHSEKVQSKLSLHEEHNKHVKDDCPHATASGKPSAYDEKSKHIRSREIDDEFPKCTVRERLELPFYQELLTPDVLYGRG